MSVSLVRTFLSSPCYSRRTPKKIRNNLSTLTADAQYLPLNIFLKSLYSYSRISMINKRVCEKCMRLTIKRRSNFLTSYTSVSNLPYLTLPGMHQSDHALDAEPSSCLTNLEKDEEEEEEEEEEEAEINLLNISIPPFNRLHRSAIQRSHPSRTR